MNSAGWVGAVVVAFVTFACGARDAADAEATGSASQPFANFKTFPNATGADGTYSTTGSIDESNPFFQSLGTNGRACVTCHAPEAGWSLTPAFVQARFDATAGMDPLFRTVDGATSPSADVSTVAARREAYALLLQRGLVRIEMSVPASAEFTVTKVEDPYGYATTTKLSLFRRPRPTTNLKFASMVMWDGREPDLATQANSATVGHAQGAALSASTRASIVAFESAMFNAQVTDARVGSLQVNPAIHPLVALSTETRVDAPDDHAFRWFKAWSQPSTRPTAEQAAVARGEAIFNDVGKGSCSSCHSALNTGYTEVPRIIDVGVSDPSEAGAGLPVYTLKNKTTGETIRTTDPGRALVTGWWLHVSNFKTPGLRGLAARAPYFHNGSVATLEGVVDFYARTRFLLINDAEKADLVAFLRAL